MVESAEALLSKTPSYTVDVVKFIDYIETRSSVENVLNQYYGNETKSSKYLYFPGSLFDFRVDEKSNLYFGLKYSRYELCKNRNCLLASLEVKEIPQKLWNRDMAAILNFQKILISLRETGKRPDIFN
ncbi:hypothetical protein MFLAVUS_002325 [Mucor flavus]|uniref:Uncharacterized protein n=1 Tax=Mucor flavus TaxID=439312 RepID=A0ABP9YPY9_9FUNG